MEAAQIRHGSRRARLGERVVPVPMERVAIVTSGALLRDVLVAIAAAGVVELETVPDEGGGEPAEALRRLEQAQPELRSMPARLAPNRPDLARLEQTGRRDLLAGEVELARREGSVVRRRSLALLVGWMPDAAIAGLSDRLRPLGAAVVALPRPAWLEPPTRLPDSPGAGQFHPLVETYGIARYEDVDPTPFAAAAFVLMFGMMFADLGQGLLLALLSLAARLVPDRRLAPLRRVWALPFAAGLAAAGFGILYGEAFGPTGLIRPLWLAPLDDPLRLLVAGVIVGCGLLTISYLLGTINRWREGGPEAAIFAAAGLAGLVMFGGSCVLIAGLALGRPPVAWFGAAAALGGVALVISGLLLHRAPGPTGVVESIVELFDAVVRMGANTISFARLAAFGMVHAAIGQVVWTGTTALWSGGRAAIGAAAAVVLFAVGNAVAFALEGLVAGIQALRLEYYELFSRIFAGEGRRFRPWHLEVAAPEEES